MRKSSYLILDILLLLKTNNIFIKYLFNLNCVCWLIGLFEWHVWIVVVSQPQKHMKSKVTQFLVVLFLALIGNVFCSPQEYQVQFDGLPTSLETSWQPGESVGFKYKSASQRPDQTILSLSNDRLAQKIRLNDGNVAIAYHVTASTDAEGWYHMNATVPVTVQSDSNWYLTAESRYLKRDLGKSSTFPIMLVGNKNSAIPIGANALTAGNATVTMIVNGTVSEPSLLTTTTTTTAQSKPTQMCRPRTEF